MKNKIAPKFRFNNSIAIQRAVTLTTYRAIYTLLDDEHPWHFWCNGMKLFRAKGVAMDLHGAHRNFNRTRVALEDTHIMALGATDEIDLGAELYYDTTNLKIVTNNSCEYHVPNLLRGGVDARLVVIGGTIYITYNITVMGGRPLMQQQVVMVYRTLTVDLTSGHICLGPERLMFAHHLPCEKNCVFDEKGNLIYSLRGGIQFIPSPLRGSLAASIVCDHMRAVEEYYGLIYFFSRQCTH